MKALVVNGSPKGDRSNTMHITDAFVQGLRDGGVEIETFVMKDHNVGYCRGCFFCWSNPNGACIIKDDFQKWLKMAREADILIYSFPVYTFGMPGLLKNLMDRQLSLHCPEIDNRDDSGETHDSRYGFGDKTKVAICTTGFYSYENNVEALRKEWELMCFNQKNEMIICPEGPLFSIKNFRDKTTEYLKSARKAGLELAQLGHITEETHQRLYQRTFGVAEYHALANNYWHQVYPHSSVEDKLKYARNFLYRMSAMTYGYKMPPEPTRVEYVVPDINFRGQIIFWEGGNTVVPDVEDMKDDWSVRMVVGIEDLQKTTPTRKVVNGEMVMVQAENTNPSGAADLATMAYRLKRAHLQKEIKL